MARIVKREKRQAKILSREKMLCRVQECQCASALHNILYTLFPFTLIRAILLVQVVIGPLDALAHSGQFAAFTFVAAAITAATATGLGVGHRTQAAWEQIEAGQYGQEYD